MSSNRYAMTDNEGHTYGRDCIESGVDFRTVCTHCAPGAPACTPLNETEMNGAFARAVIETMEEASVRGFLEAIREREVHV